MLFLGQVYFKDIVDHIDELISDEHRPLLKSTTFVIFQKKSGPRSLCVVDCDQLFAGFSNTAWCRTHVYRLLQGHDPHWSQSEELVALPDNAEEAAAYGNAQIWQGEESGVMGS